MNRRQLLQGVLAAGAAAVLPKMRAEADLFGGTIGRWDGVRIIESRLTLADIERAKRAIVAGIRRGRLLTTINGHDYYGDGEVWCNS